jgi:mono/diheme cytochrome c family protein
VFESEDYRARAAAVRVIRYSGHRLPDQVELLRTAASDPRGRVRAEAIVAASWLPSVDGQTVLAALTPEHAADGWIAAAHERVAANLVGAPITTEERRVAVPEYLAETAEREGYRLGAAVYRRDGSCATCHQPDGAGLPAAGFPPLADTPWVTGSDERLIRIALRGLAGPMEVAGRPYSGMMPGLAAVLSDAEIAGVLTYIRNSFGNRAGPISAERVRGVRDALGGETGAYSPAELLRAYPDE